MSRGWLARIGPARHAPYVLLVYATRAIAAFFVASLLTSVVTRFVGSWPAGAGVLLEPGGLMLAELVRLQRDALGLLLTQSGLVCIAMIPVGIVTSTLLMVSLAAAGRIGFARALHRCGVHLGPMVTAYAVMICLQIAVAWFMYTVASLLSFKLTAALGVRGGDIARVGLIAVGLCAAAGVSIVHDLVRASIVGGNRGTLAGISHGWRTARLRLWQVLVAFWPRGAGAVLVALLCFLLARSGGSTGVLAFAWQLGALCVVSLRASWLGRALELVREV